ncbi:MAG: sensor histidine kinase [Clostridia bacterium]|jgi:sensor histidine kinase YesM|nr:sensor histidine kinase [Clostridia bacterium]
MSQGAHTLNRIDDSVSYSIYNTIYQQDVMMSSSQYRLSLKKVLRYSKMDLKDSIFLNALKELLEKYESSHPYIYSVYLYLNGTNRIINSTTEQLAATDNFYDQDWMQEYRLMKESENQFISSRSLQFYKYDVAVDVMTIYQRMTYMDGVIVVNIKKKEFNRMIHSLLATGDQIISIVNSDGEIIFSNDDKLYGSSDFKNNIIKKIILEYQEKGVYSNNQSWVKIDGKDYFICMKQSSCFPAYQVSLLPLSYFMKNSSMQIKEIILLVIFNFFLIMFLAWITTKRSFRYIEECIEIFSAAEKGEVIEKPESAIKDEYSLVLNNIIYLYLRNNQMQVRLMEKQHQSEIAEMMALQLQINPHFIFNTLQTMDMEILKEIGKESTSHSMLQELNSIIKYIFTNPMVMVTIEEELSYLKAYFEIQYIRFPGRSIVYYEVDEDVLSYQIFRLMLQPMVENSFCHGMKGNLEPLYIKIKIKKKDSYIKFTVIDNGKGMNKQELQGVYDKINDPKSKNIGLTNLNRRLILNYGERSKLAIQSKINFATVISFEIPIEKMIHDTLYKIIET